MINLVTLAESSSQKYGNFVTGVQQFDGEKTVFPRNSTIFGSFCRFYETKHSACLIRNEFVREARFPSGKGFMATV